MKIRKQKLRDKYKAAGKEKPAISRYALKRAKQCLEREHDPNDRAVR